MSSFQRSELKDKTRAANEREERKFKIEINAIEISGTVTAKEIDREIKHVRNELITARTMSGHTLISPSGTPLRSPRLLRRESSPCRKIRNKMDDGCVDKSADNPLTGQNCLDVPEMASDPRRRSLPTNDKLHLPPIGSGSSSVVGSRRGSYNDYLSASGSRRASEGNFDSMLSTGCTPFLTPSASVSSLVSSLSNSASRLSLAEESGEIFERVRTFLEKLDEEKIQLEREKVFEDIGSSDPNTDCQIISNDMSSTSP